MVVVQNGVAGGMGDKDGKVAKQLALISEKMLRFAYDTPEERRESRGPSDAMGTAAGILKKKP